MIESQPKLKQGKIIIRLVRNVIINMGIFHQMLFKYKPYQFNKKIKVNELN